MRQKTFTLLFGSLLILLSQASAQTNTVLRESYVLRADDTVKLSVYEEPDLASEVKILKTGQAAFPLIGSLKISGLSLPEASEEIRKRYALDYIRYPKVTLTVIGYANEFVSVIGRVVKPGKIPLPQIGNLDIGSALATAGGITDNADPKNIRLVTASGENKVLTYQNIQGDSGRIILQAGDQLIVAESPFARSQVAVIGEVKNPGNVPLPRSGKLDLASALATVGGVSERADIFKIKVITSAGSSSAYSLENILNGTAGRLALNGGDRVLVSKSPYANATVTILGQINRPGTISFPIDGKLELMSAIAKGGGFTELANKKKITLIREGKSQLINATDLENQAGGTIWLMPGDQISIAERFF